MESVKKKQEIDSLKNPSKKNLISVENRDSSSALRIAALEERLEKEENLKRRENLVFLESLKPPKKRRKT